MGCRVVCISRAVGAGGEQVGRLVAERLGFLYVDEEIISRAAATAGLSAEAVADEERRKALARRVLQALVASSGGDLLGGAAAVQVADELGGEDLRTLIRESIEHTAAEGNVVIVAHAASHALTPAPDLLRVLVTASTEIRAKRIGDAAGLDRAEAKREIRTSDAARRDYLRRFYEVDEELPTQYDLVVNTDVVSAARAAELIAFAASSA
ncbi:MAG TPA: cytidylate kinase-like family protein [Gaiellaceae bacterium]|nr:cytidylate kinase-like family protein [Gaiellaceae bacterium]